MEILKIDKSANNGEQRSPSIKDISDIHKNTTIRNLIKSTVAMRMLLKIAIYHTKDKILANEMIQATFSKMPLDRVFDSPFSYLIRSLKNTITDHFKKRRQSIPIDEFENSSSLSWDARTGSVLHDEEFLTPIYKQAAINILIKYNRLTEQRRIIAEILIEGIDTPRDIHKMLNAINVTTIRTQKYFLRTFWKKHQRELMSEIERLKNEKSTQK